MFQDAYVKQFRSATSCRWTLILLIPYFLWYQRMLTWIIMFLQNRPPIKLTTIDQVFQRYCQMHLVANCSLRLTMILRATADNPIHPVFSIIFDVSQSCTLSLLSNFLTAICVLRYLYIFHWTVICMWPDALVSTIAIWAATISSCVQLIAEYGIIFYLGGSLFQRHSVWTFSGCRLKYTLPREASLEAVAFYKLIPLAIMSVLLYSRLFVDKIKMRSKIPKIVITPPPKVELDPQEIIGTNAT